MAIRVVRLGSARARGEGLRLGTVRRPPRGVPKHEFASRGFYDVWLPELARLRYGSDNELCAEPRFWISASSSALSLGRISS